MGPSKEAPRKMVPDHTPYIAGQLEATYDTTHHHPEVVVGYFTDSQNLNDPNILSDYPGIYNPTLLRQVMQTSILFALGFQPEPKAIVKVRGPLDTPKEQIVTFEHEGNGVYGDRDYALARLPEEQYELTVILPDERRYKAKTHIPGETEISVPDSIGIEVKYEPFGDGTPREEHVNPYYITFRNSPNSYMEVVQFNSSLDRELLLMKPHEEFRFTDRSNYLRTGIGYGIEFATDKQDTLIRPWSQNLNKPMDEVWMKNHWWLRFSFYSNGTGDLFFPLLDIYSSNRRWLEEIDRPAADASAQNDSTYLFDVSTIRKMDENGSMLPKKMSDAIGFFSGYFSVYRQTTIYPIRNFDLDTVVTSDENNAN